ncbi:hypothetical protein [Micrococcus terreus]|uniref:hypothetical protein n=1 Tax=Micrococcus terreus TaxID=574650 RepID=UPI003D7493E7
MTIDTRLAEIRARVETATPGPWSVYRGDRIGTYITRPDLAGVAREWSLTWSDADAEFIAASRTDVPWLLGQVELRDKALEAVMALHKRLTFPDDGIGEPTACGHCDNETWPCPTIRALAAALEVEG